MAENDGRNPIWDADGVPLALWEATLEHSIEPGNSGLSAPEVGRLRVALDTLHDSEMLAAAIARGEFKGNELIAAHREVRSARTAASAVVAALTGSPAVAGTGTWGGRRPGAGAPAKNPQAKHGNATQKKDTAA